MQRRRADERVRKLTVRWLFLHYGTDEIAHWIKSSVGNFLYFCRVQNNNRHIFNFRTLMFLSVYGAWIVIQMGLKYNPN